MQAVVKASQTIVNVWQTVVKEGQTVTKAKLAVDEHSRLVELRKDWLRNLLRSRFSTNLRVPELPAEVRRPRHQEEGDEREDQ